MLQQHSSMTLQHMHASWALSMTHLHQLSNNTCAVAWMLERSSPSSTDLMRALVSSYTCSWLLSGPNTLSYLYCLRLAVPGFWIATCTPHQMPFWLHVLHLTVVYCVLYGADAVTEGSTDYIEYHNSSQPHIME